MKKEPKITNPTAENERDYISLRDNDATIVAIPGTKKKYQIRWLKPFQIEKLGRLLVRKNKGQKATGTELDDVIHDVKLGAKAAAIYILDGLWTSKFKYWFLWRWFYYVRQYSFSQLQPILDEGKKKIPLGQFLVLSMSLTEAKGIVMNMRTEEAETIRLELLTEQRSQQQKNING